MTAQIPPSSPAQQAARSRAQSGWALGLSITAMAIACVVAVLLLAQTFFGWGLQQHGWFAYAPDGVDMGEPGALLNEGVVLVDAQGGVADAGAYPRPE